MAHEHRPPDRVAVLFSVVEMPHNASLDYS